LPIVKIESEGQPKKTVLVVFPIAVQLVALKLTVVRLLSLAKAYMPMLVTEWGIVMLVNPLQYRKALSGIVCTLLPIFKVVNKGQPEKTLLTPLFIDVQLVALKLTLTILVQP
jgi:hypothetical protein